MRPEPRTTKVKPRCTFCRRPIYKTRNGAWYHERNASVSCNPGLSGNRATPAGTPEPSNPEPRSLGGDLPLSRRCHRGRHADCLGEWTAYPGQSGPCECSCHGRSAATRTANFPQED